VIDIEAASYGPVLTMQFLFPPERPFIGGNHKNELGMPRHNKRGILVSSIHTKKAARDQAEYIKSVARVAVLAARWEMPDYVRMDILAVNIDADRDNVSKPCADAMEGLCYSNDRRIKTGDITLMRAKGVPRVIVAIQAIHGKAFGYPKPSNRRGAERNKEPSRRTYEHVSERPARATPGKSRLSASRC
jgi:Holliday junction resolvase RusA-like endonuclease